MKPIIWTEGARNDLRAIDVWLTRERSKQLAVTALASIHSRAKFLRDFPHGGRPMPGQDFRVLKVTDTPYLILYRLTAEGIAILRLRHEREDWQALD